MPVKQYSKLAADIRFPSEAWTQMTNFIGMGHNLPPVDSADARLRNSFSVEGVLPNVGFNDNTAPGVRDSPATAAIKQLFPKIKAASEATYPMPEDCLLPNELAKIIKEFSGLKSSDTILANGTAEPTPDSQAVKATGSHADSA
ncbi:MAG: hypothetical protein LBQ12_00080, partial [Deltaproteobacteria bacterium]|nr:hypothetical protein [Deltaproteobacteria bacterium]